MQPPKVTKFYYDQKFLYQLVTLIDPYVVGSYINVRLAT